MSATLLLWQKRLFVGFFSLAILGNAYAAFEYEEPKNETERAALIEEMMKEGQWSLALEQIQKGIKINPKSAQLKFQRAVVYQRSGQLDRAKALFEEFIKTYPEVVEPYNNLAAIYASEGNTRRARALLRQAITINPHYSMAYENLGDLELQEALKFYKDALNARPDDKRLQRKVRTIEKQIQ
ncbi:MAG TPA: tetratricopeptide repeat protein [Candidatus Aphodousia faecipullorum]|nr:tetratricopeptide repeat protein [Candidatus Aphodousia faecipullorum]